MPVSHEVAHHRARLGSAVANGDALAASIARRDLRAVLLREYVERTIAELPPLTDRQCDIVARLLRPSAAGHDD